ncbi:DUF6473 family protein [Yoonia sediminilitoris]|uniref:DUF6473 domain-containing protein n=1 Tax=Yoonia sediminilitoris TaxID=1286148 RepID=A0A2T6KGZ8_9RHOB|nr:DUF6473 family protein [Yoonia sediminilitoris]PUB14792.1 hypothetical protein C8N45_10513 [Yoonia sediminilitoris]RCW95509.1 hypothetical protein DFP92_10513 [Yoonia sediminilitoris]
MKQEVIETEELSYSPCRYGASRMLFRGPRRRLDRPYIAFIGGTETYGKFISKPFPAQVEKIMRQTCVNLGCVNGGIDAFVNDPTIMEICQGADMTVVQIMGANLLSNRFYSVHPRRNDRFLRASTVLQAIYQDVDFSDFSFIRHMLGALHAKSPDRFETVVKELREAWTARMTNMLRQTGRRTILLWFSEDDLNDEHWSDRSNQLQADPLFVTRAMLEDLRPLVQDIVVVNPSSEALSQGTCGMIYPESQESAASEMMGVDCHTEACAALIPSLRENLYKPV